MTDFRAGQKVVCIRKEPWPIEDKPHGDITKWPRNRELLTIRAVSTSNGNQFLYFHETKSNNIGGREVSWASRNFKPVAEASRGMRLLVNLLRHPSPPALSDTIERSSFRKRIKTKG